VAALHGTTNSHSANIVMPADARQARAMPNFGAYVAPLTAGPGIDRFT
jgi:hypothetical protein